MIYHEKVQEICPQAHKRKRKKRRVHWWRRNLDLLLSSSTSKYRSSKDKIPREETLNGKRQKHLKENKRQKVRNQELCPSREIRNLTTFTRLMDYNNGFSISSFFLSLLSFLWIGAQFPQEKFLSYGRILTLHYYFLLMCILFSFICLCLFHLSL